MKIKAAIAKGQVSVKSAQNAQVHWQNRFVYWKWSNWAESGQGPDGVCWFVLYFCPLKQGMHTVWEAISMNVPLIWDLQQSHVKQAG